MDMNGCFRADDGEYIRRWEYMRRWGVYEKV